MLFESLSFWTGQMDFYILHKSVGTMPTWVNVFCFLNGIYNIIISTSANTTHLRIASSKTSDKETEKHKTQKTNQRGAN